MPEWYSGQWTKKKVEGETKWNNLQVIYNHTLTRCAGTICNPYTGEPTEKQLTVRQKFADTIEALNALTEEQKEAYIEAFRKQKKCKTLRGFIFSQLYNTSL